MVISANGEVIGRCLADRYRTDLVKVTGSGLNAFDFRPAVGVLSPLEKYEIVVRHEGDGAHLFGSPQILEPSTKFDGTTRNAITHILSTIDDDDDCTERLAFLQEKIDWLRGLYSERSSGLDEKRRRHEIAWQEFGREKAAELSAKGADKPRALVIDERMPILNNDAGSNAILSHMLSLRRLGYDVCFVPLNLRGDPAVLEQFAITSYVHPWFFSVEEVLQRQRETFALIYMHRENAARYTALARRYQPKARLIYSVADLHFVRLHRQAQVESRPELRGLAERTRITELSAAIQSDAVITHSNAEAATLCKAVPEEKVHVIPWSVQTKPTAVPFLERRGFAFIGGYAHRPNVDAAHWLVDRIVPAVREMDSIIPCFLVGSNMPKNLLKLKTPHVEPVGRVADLAEIFDRVRVTIAPLAYGAGIKGKVLDSLAAGVPCVCTPAGAEGLDLPPPLKDQVASTPAGLAQKIIALHDNEALNAACAAAGLEFMAKLASEERVDALMRSAAGLKTSMTFGTGLLAGTRIRTQVGLEAVDTLVSGRMVITASGNEVPIKWVGRQAVTAASCTEKRNWPIRLSAGSLGRGQPTSDVLVTGDFTFLLEASWVSAGALVNGGSIRRVPPPDLGASFVVHHIELEGSDPILVEGIPGGHPKEFESLKLFDNFLAYDTLFGTKQIVDSDKAPPVIQYRYQLPATLLSRLAEQESIHAA